jgi:hypothetical protein
MEQEKILKIAEEYGELRKTTEELMSMKNRLERIKSERRQELQGFVQSCCDEVATRKLINEAARSNPNTFEGLFEVMGFLSGDGFVIKCLSEDTKKIFWVKNFLSRL